MIKKKYIKTIKVPQKSKDIKQIKRCILKRQIEERNESEDDENEKSEDGIRWVLVEWKELKCQVKNQRTQIA